MMSSESTTQLTTHDAPIFTILHTNDFHNHFTADQADIIKKRREALGNRCLLLDAGDAVGSGNITFLPGGEPILDRMNETGYDAMTVGNREFHFSAIGFKAKLSRAKFPILCANISLNRPNDHEKQSFHKSNPDMPVVSLKEFNSKIGRIIVFGLTVPMITSRMAVRKVSAYLFREPVSFASDFVPEIINEYHPDLLIALTHIGIKQDRLLAENVPGIDLIISGHTHVVLEEGVRVKDTLIAQTGCFGKNLGSIEIFSDADAKNGFSCRARLEPL